MRILLHGCNGKMGQVMTRVLAESPDMQVVCGVDLAPERATDRYPVYQSLQDALEALEAPGHEVAVDLIIDFSHHSALGALLAFGLARGVPLLICTTGFSEDERQRMAEASATIPILNSVNMSLGVNLIASLVKQVAPALAPDFDIEIVERHHNQKVDAPSGTALMMAGAINSALGGTMEYVFDRHARTGGRGRDEIGISSVRGGAIVGEHEVIFAGPGEVVEIRHQALSRDVFAYGAVRAARFLAGKGPGLYSMEDVIRA